MTQRGQFRMAFDSVSPLPDDPEKDLHMFRCEICSATEFFRFIRPSRASVHGPA